jgi:hypothetical protein
VAGYSDKRLPRPGRSRKDDVVPGEELEDGFFLRVVQAETVAVGPVDECVDEGFGFVPITPKVVEEGTARIAQRVTP